MQNGAMTVTAFLIIHGFGGSTEGHWQEWLAKKLREAGFPVYFPQLPDWFHPDKDTWLSALKETMDRIKEEKLVVVTHSLGCVLWLHYAALKAGRKAARVILVSPPSPHLRPGALRVFFPDSPEKERQAEESVQRFYPFPAETGILQSAADRTVIVASSTDPFLPDHSILDYTVYQVPIILLPDMGHINLKTGYGPWPWILDVCLHGRVPGPVDHDDAGYGE